MDILEAGGPQYPSETNRLYYHGMTLRDRFALEAMKQSYALFSSGAQVAQHWSTEGIADSAYAMADAMLKARMSTQAGIADSWKCGRILDKEGVIVGCKNPCAGKEAA